MKNNNTRLVVILSSAVLILMLPLVAMQFTDEVFWTASDFIIAGILLFSTGLGVEWALRKLQKATHRLAVCAIILLAFFLVWAELAVGIFNSPIAGS
ncbi:hypothetical protein [Litoribacter populi]|uniref:hypothetical protein n=1 Tax=Litoribacter populi TaxID=2598460 RepID=UPI00117E02FA|nr:hypothetical protein [Litoribacter populi]